MAIFKGLQNKDFWVYACKIAMACDVTQLTESFADALFQLVKTDGKILLEENLGVEKEA